MAGNKAQRAELGGHTMLLVIADVRVYRDLNLLPVLSWSSSMVPPHLRARVRSVIIVIHSLIWLEPISLAMV